MTTVLAGISLKWQIYCFYSNGVHRKLHGGHNNIERNVIHVTLVLDVYRKGVSSVGSL